MHQPCSERGTYRRRANRGGCIRQPCGALRTRNSRGRRRRRGRRGGGTRGARPGRGRDARPRTGMTWRRARTRTSRVGVEASRASRARPGRRVGKSGMCRPERARGLCAGGAVARAPPPRITRDTSDPGLGTSLMLDTSAPQFFVALALVRARHGGGRATPRAVVGGARVGGRHGTSTPAGRRRFGILFRRVRVRRAHGARSA